MSRLLKAQTNHCRYQKKGAKIYSIGKYNYMDYDLASNITDYEAYTFKGKIIAKPLAEYMP